MTNNTNRTFTIVDCQSWSAAKSWLRTYIKSNLLLILTISAILTGVIMGMVLRKFNLSDDTMMIIGFPGELLKRMFRMVFLPLIVTSLLSGMEQVDFNYGGRIGTYAIVYYFSTTILSTGLGIGIALLFKPGIQGDVHKRVKNTESDSQTSSMDIVFDSLRNMFPENVITATFRTIKTEFIRGPELNISGNEEGLNWRRIENVTAQLTGQNGTDIGTELHFYQMVRSMQYQTGANLLGIMIFCIAFGLICGKLGEEGKTLMDQFVVLNKVVSKVIRLCMWYTPFGMASFIMTKVLSIPNIYLLVKQLGMFILAVNTGLVIHGFVVLPLIYYVVTRKNPFTFFKGMLQAFFTAIGTASSSTTLPFTFRCLEENNKIDERVTKLMLPMATSINKDGTSLFKVIAVIFIAQRNGMDFNVGQIFFVSVTAMVGAAIPSGGLITLVLVLSVLGLPIKDIIIIIPIDFFLDRLRTSINVMSDAYGVDVVYHMSKSKLDKFDALQKTQHLEEIQQTSSHITENSDSESTTNKLNKSKTKSLQTPNINETKI